MTYIENPKTKGSGIICCIPQSGVCPVGCDDCFFQSGRSYLEPLKDNLPNMPTIEQVQGKIVRVNDGNDSSNQQEKVIQDTKQYPMRFYNTSNPENLEAYEMPVVLTVNPAEMTDKKAHLLRYPIPKNLMFVRVRSNTWNIPLIDNVVQHYAGREEGQVPVVLTFMAYFNETIPEEHKENYIYRKRTMNSYWAITTDAWRKVMSRYQDNCFVHSCGKIEGERGKTSCKLCGNCLREYFATMEKIRG